MDISNSAASSAPSLACFEEARDAAMSDPANQMAIMLLEHAKTSRQHSRQQTQLEEAHLNLMQQRHVQELRKQASQIRQAGRHRGYGMIVTGIATMATASQPQTNAVAGWSDGVKGISELGASECDAVGKKCEAEATKFAHQAGESERRLQDLQEQRAHLKELQRTAFDHLRSVHEIRASTDQAITSWRG